MRIEADKAREIAATLKAAQDALMAAEDNGSNGAIAGRCAVLMVFLEHEIEQQTVRVFHLTGTAN
ncbi:hypothetical protein C9I56_39035 [Paraburkholderia caribensis]|uniref:hypothetical protein n=1 Tax=Paraburkholderia caribensis TaxID=75105 RepID=UPI000D17DBF0|nr:hypothetical protein [Paraburkholderia caribensis]PTB23485.1 hypothetical protein C9I56_39035 [Paraburkholderia caribensis]